VLRILTFLVAIAALCGATSLAQAQGAASKGAKDAPKPAPAPAAKPTAAKPAAKPEPAATAAAGGAEPTLIGQYGTWGAYTATPNGRKVCFALAKPSSSKTNPPNRPRDPAYAFVSTRPAEKVVNEVSIMIGYALKPGSESSLEVGGSMEADQIIAQKTVEVGGDLKTIKGTRGDIVELGHGSQASGPIVARKVSVGHGGKVEDVYADTLEMEHGSRARNLYFREGVIEAGVQVEGEVLYTDNIEASPDVKFARPASKVKDLPKPPL